MKARFQMSKQELKNWMAGSPERNVKELKWQLIDMGIYLNEWDIREIQEQLAWDACRCPDDSGSCLACMTGEY
jgi:hypothetical protein